ncbi:MBG domain-containing protein, partial [Adhaeribacter aerolatus]|uniref:MBG domain-containing protein n=1 Tax=Adhaeribacter aerolatus TaxID=670289 RepID=UPI0011BD6676
VTPATLTITANPSTKVYGQTNPAFSVAYTGFVNGDDASKLGGTLAYATAATTASPVGSYDVTPSGLTSGNYTIGFVKGTLTVTPRPITITAVAKTKYCGQVDPALTYSITSGSLVGTDAFTGTLTREAGNIVGTYAIQQGTVALSNNYALSYASTNLTITGVTVDVSENSLPQAVKTTATTLTIKVLNKIEGVEVKLYFDGAETPKIGSTDANGIATFNVGILETGVYTVRAVAGAECSESIAYLPIYDPNGGFVTGGGWIESPVVPATSTACSTCSYMRVGGKANFGFVAKYKKGLTEVDGNTEFNFKAGDLNFKSSSLTAASLVVTPTKAIYKGVGSINGTEGYTFMVSAIDGSPDKFRIKIWETNNTANIVYDNQAGAAENADAAMAIGGGSIVIQQAGKKSERVATEAEIFTGTEAAKLTSYPNPFTDQATIEFALDTDEEYNLMVYSVRGSLVKALKSGKAQAKTPVQVQWGDATTPAGVYIVRLTTKSGTKTLRIVKD